MMAPGERTRYVGAGLAAAAVTFALYLGVVIAATPTFAPAVVVGIVLEQNGPVMVLVSLGVGTMVGLALASRDAGCSIEDAGAAGAGGGAFGVFASMFALTSVGCCGVFVFWMGILFGAGAAAFLAAYSTPLTAAGLLVMAASIAVLARRVRRQYTRGEPRG